MSAKNQSFFMVRNVCPRLPFVHLNLTKLGPVLMQKIASVFSTNICVTNRSIVGSSVDLRTFIRTGFLISQSQPLFSGLNFPPVSIFPVSPSRPLFVFNSTYASLAASAYGDKGCTYSQIPKTKVQTPIKTQTIKPKNTILYEILFEIWSLIGHWSSNTSSFVSSRVAIFGHFYLGFDWSLGIGHWVFRLPNSI